MARPTSNLVYGRFRLNPNTDILHDVKQEIEPFPASRLDDVLRNIFDSALERLCRAVIRNQEG